MSRVLHRYSPLGSKAIPLLLTGLTLIAVATACGGGSSGRSASPGTTLNAALKLQQQGKLAHAGSSTSKPSRLSRTTSTRTTTSAW